VGKAKGLSTRNLDSRQNPASLTCRWPEAAWSPLRSGLSWIFKPENSSNLGAGHKRPSTRSPFPGRMEDSNAPCACIPLLAPWRGLVGPNRPPSSHLLYEAGDFTFCIPCGAHSRISVRKLGRSYPRKVRKQPWIWLWRGSGTACTRGHRLLWVPLAPFHLRCLSLHGLEDRSDTD